MKKKIISVEEFFRLKEMFDGSDEDHELAWEIYNNAYEDKVIIGQLIAKALMFKNRARFVDAVKFKFIANTKEIYAFIDTNTFNDIYTDILKKLIDE